MNTPDTHISSNQQSEITHYEPPRDVKQVANHLFTLATKSGKELTNIDCLQAIADVATLFGASEPNGLYNAVLPLKGQLHIDIHWNESDQIGRVEVWRKVPERGRKTYGVDNKYSFISVIHDGQRVFSIGEDNKQRKWAEREVTPDDRFKVVQDIVRAFTYKAK